MNVRLIVVGILVALMGWSATVGATDIKESKDHPLLKRYMGASIIQYDHKAFDEYVVPLDKEMPSATVGGEQFTKSAHLEGDITRIMYSIPQGRSTLEVMRNYEGDLKKQGYVSLYASTGKEAERIFYISKQFERGYGNDIRFNVWKRTRPEGDIHVVLYSFASIGDPHVGSQKGQKVLYAHVIIEKPMESNRLIPAQEMAEEISANGRVALYGIYFDTKKTDLMPESDPTLQETARLLKTHPDLKLLVVGHTDKIGTYSFNLDLSQRRAQVVVNTLVARYGGGERPPCSGRSFIRRTSGPEQDGRGKGQEQARRIG